MINILSALGQGGKCCLQSCSQHPYIQMKEYGVGFCLIICHMDEGNNSKGITQVIPLPHEMHYITCWSHASKVTQAEWGKPRMFPATFHWKLITLCTLSPHIPIHDIVHVCYLAAAVATLYLWIMWHRNSSDIILWSNSSVLFVQQLKLPLLVLGRI